MINRKCYDNLLENHAFDNSNALVITGEDGIGKSHFMSNFLNKFPYVDILSFSPAYLKSDYSPILSTLSKREIVNLDDLSHFFKESERASYTQFAVYKKDGLNFREYIMHSLIKYCRDHPQILITIDHFEDFETDAQSFFIDFLRLSADREFPATLFLIELLDQEPRNSATESAISSLSSVAEFTQYIVIPKWSKEELLILLNNIVGEKIEIEQDTLDYVLNCSSGNPAKLKSILEYLKSKKIIYDNSGIIFCNGFEKDLLFREIKKEIITRYERLDEIFKKIMQRSSIIGKDFEGQLLEYPFKFNDVEAKLKIIESLSKLIQRKSKGIYEFESTETHRSIKDIVSEDEAIAWNKILGEYFWECGLECFQSANVINYIDCMIKSSFYYQEAGEHGTVFHIYERLIPICISLTQYSNANKFIDKAIELALMLRLPEKEYWKLYYFKAECHSCLFQFEKASNYYKTFLEQRSLDKLEFLKVQCLYVMSLYNSGEMVKPYEVLLELKSQLTMKVTRTNASVYVKIISSIASIEETLLIESWEQHFNEALWCAKKFNLKDEYYELLRRSTIVHKGKLAIGYLDAAKTHYEQTNNKNELAMTLHNIATEMLLEDDLEVARELLEKSLNIFQSFGSDAAHYVHNALGCCECLRGDYEKALLFFEKAFDERHELFSKMGILLNQSSALRKAGDLFLSRIKLDNALELLQQPEAKLYNIIKPHFILCSGLLALESGDHKEAYNNFLEYVDDKYMKYRGHHRLILCIQNIKRLCDEFGYIFPDKLKEFQNAQSVAANRLLIHNISFVRFSFVE